MKKTRLVAICNMIFFLERDDLTSFTLGIKEMGSSIEISKTEPNGEIKIGQYKISYKFEEEIENSSKKFEKKVEVCLLKKNEIIYQKVFNSDQRTIFIMLPEKF